MSMIVSAVSQHSLRFDGYRNMLLWICLACNSSTDKFGQQLVSLNWLIEGFDCC